MAGLVTHPKRSLSGQDHTQCFKNPTIQSFFGKRAHDQICFIMRSGSCDLCGRAEVLSDNKTVINVPMPIMQKNTVEAVDHFYNPHVLTL